MGVANFFKNEKAILEILDLRGIQTATVHTVPGSNSKMAITPEARDRYLSMFSGNALDTFEKLSSEWMYRELKDFKGTKKKFQVQFNPNELTIEGHGGGRMATTAYNNPGDQSKNVSSNIAMMPVPVHIKLTVKLLFDRMDPSDSFLSAKTNIAASELARSAVKNTVKAASKKTKLTIQQEVEGLIAALRSPYTRCITFNWADMSYEGVLNRVASQYTMFNTSGEPVRAVVQLSLICADQNVNPHSLGSWQKAYNSAFGAGSNSLVNAGQKVGSLLNIGK